MKSNLFQSCGHCWVFQICWRIECSTFTASSFRIWSSSTGIPSPPLALFVVMLPKAHLTSHSRISGSRWVWVITPSWLSGSWRSFLYRASVYSCHLYLISSATVRSIPFLQWLCFAGSRGEIPHVQGKRHPSKTAGAERGNQRAEGLKPQSQTTSQCDHTDHSLV